MSEQTDSLVLGQFRQITAGVADLSAVLAQLVQRLEAVDQRLSHVERCVVNLHINHTQNNRAVWTETERSAFCNWIAENLTADEANPFEKLSSE